MMLILKATWGIGTMVSLEFDNARRAAYRGNVEKVVEFCINDFNNDALKLRADKRKYLVETCLGAYVDKLPRVIDFRVVNDLNKLTGCYK